MVFFQWTKKLSSDVGIGFEGGEEVIYTVAVLEKKIWVATGFEQESNGFVLCASHCVTKKSQAIEVLIVDSSESYVAKGPCELTESV